MTDPTPRWQDRFKKYGHALAQLREAVELDSPTPLETDATIYRFSRTVCLGWATMRDYLAHEGMTPEMPRTKHVMRGAFKAGVIKQTRVWQKALSAHHRVSGRYDPVAYRGVITDIRSTYLVAFDELHHALKHHVTP